MVGETSDATQAIGCTSQSIILWEKDLNSWFAMDDGTHVALPFFLSHVSRFMNLGPFPILSSNIPKLGLLIWPNR